MKHLWRYARLAAIATLMVGTGLSTMTVEAKPAEPKRDKPKTEDPPEWSDPTVQGTIDKLYWAEGKTAGTWTPTLEFFSRESDLEVIVYVDNPDAQQLVRAGTACVGRFVVASGFRIDEQNLSADGLQVLNPEAGCGATLGPPPS